MPLKFSVKCGSGVEVLSLGISLELGSQIGTKYGQNAIVWAGSDAIPKLVLLR